MYYDMITFLSLSKQIESLTKYCIKSIYVATTRFLFGTNDIVVQLYHSSLKKEQVENTKMDSLYDKINSSNGNCGLHIFYEK